jgi:hypothetical protein
MQVWILPVIVDASPSTSPFQDCHIAHIPRRVRRVADSICFMSGFSILSYLSLSIMNIFWYPDSQISVINSDSYGAA